jgi:hypothetical protein
MAGGEGEGEPAAHTEPDHPYPDRAVLPLGQVSTPGLDPLERRALPCRVVPHDLAQAAYDRATAEQVRCRSQQARLGQPAGLRDEVARHPGGVVQHHDTRPRPRPDRHRHVRR